MGKLEGVFLVFDLMWLLFGILIGMGFIGGGVIFYCDGLVFGVIMVVMLWFVMVIGLCIGGG